jgi:hypothetical protein
MKTKPIVISWCLFLVLALAGAGGAAQAAEPAYQVIVHPDNPVTEVSRGFLKNAFLKKATSWGDGETLRPVDLAKKHPVRAQFAKDVLKKTLAQLKNYWNQLIFSGKGTPPPELDSEAAVIAFVLANRGAVGYLPAGSSAGGAKVVKVK